MPPGDRIGLLVPGPVAIVFFFWLLAGILVHQPHLISGDGDPARHIHHGLWILEHGSLIYNDPFSYTRPGEPFVGFEYGSQILFGLMHRAAGLAGVVALSLVLMALMPALVAWFLLKRRVDPLLAFIGALLSGVVAQVHFVARPHLFTFIFTLVLLAWLERGRRPPWWAFALLFTVWVNLHGGVVFGVVLVTLYLLAAILQALSRNAREAALAEAKGLSLILVVGIGALFLTPYGTEVPIHLVNFFGEPFLREHTEEFNSPNFHLLGMKPFLFATLAMMLILAWLRERPQLRWLLVMVATTGFALLAQRNVALYAATAMPLLFLHIDQVWRRLPDWRELRAGFEITTRATRSGGWVLLGSAAMGGLALNDGEMLGLQVLRNQFDPRVFPVAIVEEARAEEMEGRIFHEFTWGGWLLYAWPEQKVFIDGGTDFYGSELLRTFIEIRRMLPEWRNTLEAYRIDHVLLSVETPLAHELAREPGWGLRTCDAVGVLLSRDQPRTGLEADSLMSCLEERRHRASPGSSR